MWVGVGGDFLWLYTEMKVEANVNASRLMKFSKLSEMGLLAMVSTFVGFLSGIFSPDRDDF